MPTDNPSKRYVSYLRVSTAKQGASGLGIEAQRHAVSSYLKAQGNAELLKEFVETESGKNNERPVLAEAMEHASLTGATVVIAKLDRLSRNAHFLTGLAERKVRFVACDMPEANELVVGMMALIAQHEVKAISQRTKAALQAAKARGIQLGNPQWEKNLKGKGNEGSTEAQHRAAVDRATLIRNKLDAIRKAGHTTLAKIAAELERQGITTPRGGKWHPMMVKRVMARLEVGN